MDTALKIIGWIASPVFGVIIGALVAKIQSYKKKANDKEERSDAEHKALMASCRYMLKKHLEDDYHYHVEKLGWCSIAEKAYIDEVYRTYHDGLHGNGQGTLYHNSIMDLPEKPPIDKKD